MIISFFKDKNTPPKANKNTITASVAIDEVLAPAGIDTPPGMTAWARWNAERLFVRWFMNSWYVEVYRDKLGCHAHGFAWACERG